MTPVVERAPTKRRPERDGGTCVAADGFGDDIVLWQLGQLLADFGDLRGVGDDENVFHRHQRQHTVHGLLEKGALAEQREQLFGHLLAAQRPETLAASAGHDDHETVFEVSLVFTAPIQHG